MSQCSSRTLPSAPPHARSVCMHMHVCVVVGGGGLPALLACLMCSTPIPATAAAAVLSVKVRTSFGLLSVLAPCTLPPTLPACTLPPCSLSLPLRALASVSPPLIVVLAAAPSCTGRRKQAGPLCRGPQRTHRYARLPSVGSRPWVWLVHVACNGVQQRRYAAAAMHGLWVQQLHAAPAAEQGGAMQRSANSRRHGLTHPCGAATYTPGLCVGSAGVEPDSCTSPLRVAVATQAQIRFGLLKKPEKW